MEELEEEDHQIEQPQKAQQNGKIKKNQVLSVLFDENSYYLIILLLGSMP